MYRTIILNTPLLPLIYTLDYKTIDSILWDCWTFYTCAAKQTDKVNGRDPER